MEPILLFRAVCWIQLITQKNWRASIKTKALAVDLFALFFDNFFFKLRKKGFFSYLDKWKGISENIVWLWTMRSTSETVDGSALPLESVNNIKSSDGFSSGVLSVGDSISDDTLEESLEDLSGVVINEGRDSLDTSSSGESSDSGLGDAFNRSLVGSLLSDSLGSNLSFSTNSFTSFSSSSHFVINYEEFTLTFVLYYDKSKIINFLIWLDEIYL